MEEKFELDARDVEEESATFQESARRSQALWEDLPKNPAKYRVLTGERPTGPLHIGHLFGTLQNRVRIQALGVSTFIVIADYQVLTDRDTADAVGTNVHEVILDYLASGLDPDNGRTFFFSHSHVPELNQLLLPFMSLVTTAELDRNPTVKEEIRAAGLRQVNALMYTYPIHQAADILFCKGNVVPVGRDQLPHLELTRKVARRYNERFSPKQPLFPVPEALLSEFPVVLGTDGQKMSKSRNNAILLKMSADETARVIKSAKTDADRQRGRPIRKKRTVFAANELYVMACFALARRERQALPTPASSIRVHLQSRFAGGSSQPPLGASPPSLDGPYDGPFRLAATVRQNANSFQ